MISNFNDFLNQYDKPTTIILLEGKRTVLPSDVEKLILLGEFLAKNTTHCRYRSGNASGADELFCKKIIELIPERLEIIIPYSNHRKSKHANYSVTSLDNIDLVQEPELIYGSKQGTSNDSLIDAYALGNRNRYAIKAAYLIRDTAKVLGTTQLAKASFGLFYDDLSKPMTGGTGHTMKVCTKQKVPFINQSTWFDWLN